METQMTVASFNLDKLKDRDYVVVMDESGSMDETDTPNGLSRWNYMKESVISLGKKLQEYDPDGITVIPFNGTHKVYENSKSDVISDVFAKHSPDGATVLAPVLDGIFARYEAARAAGNTKANGQIVLVITDGQPQDQKAVAQSISNFTQKLNDGRREFGISFVQVGKDIQAAKFLKSLDDDLKGAGAKYDIVDTVTMDEIVTGKTLEDTLIGALTD
jgi:Mg-chelatase subunit ChlD